MEDTGIERKEEKTQLKSHTKKLINIIFWVLIFIILIGLFAIIMLLKSEGGQCIANSFLYGANKQVKGGGIVECSCIQYQENGDQLPFRFNNTNWWATPAEKPIYAFNP
jgi:flagellar basal body-associated protein FliL